MYRCDFEYDRDPERPVATLIFEGLDTLCDVYLVRPYTMPFRLC